MDSRWILERKEDGRIVSDVLPDGRPFIYRALWVHDCLELDPQARTAIYRDQQDTVSDDPREWQGRPFPLRRIADRWQTEIEWSDWERWVKEEQDTSANRREFAQRYPTHALAANLEEAEQRLEAIREIGHGWVNLPKDVSDAIDKEFGEHRP